MTYLSGSGKSTGSVLGASGGSEGGLFAYDERHISMQKKQYDQNI